MNILFENDTGSLGVVDCLKVKSSDISSDIQIKASTTYGYNSESNNRGIDIIFEDNDKRWLSQNIKNQYFEITFQKKNAYIYGYSMKWSSGRRYNENWIVEGWDGKWFLLDTQKKANACFSKNNGVCNHEILIRKVTDTPSVVSKLKFTATSVDSNNENFFSLTHLKLYGLWGAKIKKSEVRGPNKRTFLRI